MGHINWQSLSVNPGKPNVQQHQELLDIMADHSLHQLVDKSTRKDKTLDLMLKNYPSFFDNVETAPPIGASDHDIVVTKCNISLKRNKCKSRNILQYTKANWDGVKSDIDSVYNTMLEQQDKTNIDELWRMFKDRVHTSISKNIPKKLVKGNKKLPWITDPLRRKMRWWLKQWLRVESRPGRRGASKSTQIPNQGHRG